MSMYSTNKKDANDIYLSMPISIGSFATEPIVGGSPTAYFKTNNSFYKGIYLQPNTIFGLGIAGTSKQLVPQRPFLAGSLTSLSGQTIPAQTIGLSGNAEEMSVIATCGSGSATITLQVSPDGTNFLPSASGTATAANSLVWNMSMQSFQGSSNPLSWPYVSLASTASSNTVSIYYGAK